MTTVEQYEREQRAQAIQATIHTLNLEQDPE